VSKAAVISFYPAVAFLFRLPSKANVRKAAQQLNLIGYGLMLAAQQFENSVDFNGKKTDWAAQNHKAVCDISVLLRVDTSY
jgi:hypothetical protein